MRKASLARLFVVFSEIPRGMKELFWDDRRPESDLVQWVEDRFSMHPGGAAGVMQRVLEPSPGGIKAGVSALEQGAHLGGHQRICQPRVRAFLPHFLEIERVRRIQVNDAMISRQRANARLPGCILEREELHRVWWA
jgi:hypothetical protein